jgi:hypothetical protein
VQRARSAPGLGVLLATFVACGSRTGIDSFATGAAVRASDGGTHLLDGGGGDEAGSPGVDAGTDAGSPPIDGGGAPLPQTCPSWTSTTDPVQVSSIASIIDVQTALAVPTGVLVGYGDIQVPPVDPNWHGRVVSFGDGVLGPEQTYFSRDGSLVAWNRVTFAQGFGHAAAAASDMTDGALFVATDASGSPVGSIVPIEPSEVRALFATQTGFSALLSPFITDESGDNPGPVSLATLDTSGNLESSTQLVGNAPPLESYARVAFSDGSFALLSSTVNASSTIVLQHFSSVGVPIAKPTTLQAENANGYTLTASATSSGLLLVSTNAAGTALVGTPFDRDGNPAGSSTTFAQASTGIVLIALAEAPGGDVLVAWFDGGGASGEETNVRVVSVAADGTAEGPPTTVATTTAAEDSSLVVAASTEGAMVFYDDDAQDSIEVFAVPLRCNP